MKFAPPTRVVPVASATLFCALVLLGSAHLALARDIPCSAVEPDVIDVDGLLGDWSDVQGLWTQDAAHIRAGKNWDGPDDLSFSTRCNYDDKKLYLAIDVHDDRLVRTKKANPQEDHVEVLLGGGARLLVYPADLKQDIPRVVKWRGKPAPPQIQAAEAMQPRGWSVEIAIPWKMVPGYSSGVAQVRGAIQLADADSKAPLRQDTLMSTSEGRIGALVLSEGSELLDAFLEQLGAKRSDVTFNRTVDMGGDAGLERVVRVGKVVGVIGKEYLFFDLPVQSVKDVLEFRLLDLAGDGKHSVVVRYVERGGGGQREVLAVWKIVGPQFRRTFACEVGKQEGGNKLVTRYSFVSRGRAHDLVLQAAPAVGFSASNYQESSASDMVPILLPWQEPKRVRYRFQGDEYFQMN